MATVTRQLRLTVDNGWGHPSWKKVATVTCLPQQFSFSSLSMLPSIDGVGAEEQQQHGEGEWCNNNRRLNDGDGILEVNNEEKVWMGSDGYGGEGMKAEEKGWMMNTKGHEYGRTRILNAEEIPALILWFSWCCIWLLLLLLSKNVKCCFRWEEVKEEFGCWSWSRVVLEQSPSNLPRSKGKGMAGSQYKDPSTAQLAGSRVVEYS